MTTWFLTLWLATGEARTLPHPYADEATCRIAARIVEARARVLHALHPSDTVAVAWVTCEMESITPQVTGRRQAVSLVSVNGNYDERKTA